MISLWSGTEGIGVQKSFRYFPFKKDNDSENEIWDCSDSEPSHSIFFQCFLQNKFL